MRQRLLPILLVFLLARALVAAQAAPDSVAIARVSTQLDDVRYIIREYYSPAAKVTPAFFERCAATDQALTKAQSLNEAHGLIADALASLDPRIWFFPSIPANRVDYSWEWRLIGPAAYVTQVDREGDAAKQGLAVGDRILSIEGIPLGRENFQQLYYLFATLTPRPGLRVEVQSPGQEPRLLAIASTIRPQQFRRDGSRIYTKEQDRRRDELWEPKSHVRQVGKVAVWQADELRIDNGAVAKGLKLTHDATSLVLDLRGQYVRDHDTVLRLLNGLFTEGFDVGVVQKDGLDEKLRIGGDRQAFTGLVLVLVDSETAGYAEVLAHVIQQRQRGVIIGDRTMGRVFEEKLISFLRGRVFSYEVGGIRVPAGEVVLADGVALDGAGVPPDYQVLSKPADLSARRDVALAKAFALLKEPLSPEDAYKLFPHYGDVDDDF